MEWSKETELFIIFIYYVIPVVILGLVFIGVILLLRNLIRIRNKKKNQRNRK
ncbi:flagellar biosynthesis/type III secretory pathway M-ring protein FliF/YscJ [Cytobacillus purgationiresistens]|uniref:Flagellar biosynthesis/type III secretory pathway M-ring protein FliF/YscJ n=1 Tax=Cytobacillus purgationiresistens TaxID=863449 RepID=A0ABU0AF16_9BACI|nr:flagellar biosynthesis/type III secretory pathway M-ring protein FliF/YscJ [Cytobacillus purgationiresistens]